MIETTETHALGADDGIIRTTAGPLGWAEAVAAALQDDRGLAAAYRGIVREAARHLASVSVSCVGARHSETGRAYYIAEAWALVGGVERPVGLGDRMAFFPTEATARAALVACGLGGVEWGRSGVTLEGRLVRRP